MVHCKEWKCVRVCSSFSTDIPTWLSDKESPAKAGDAEDTGSISGLKRSPRGGNGNPLQYSYLENPMKRGAWHVTGRSQRVGHN